MLVSERGIPLRDVAAQLGVSINTVRNYSDRLELPPRNPDYLKPCAPARLRRLYEVDDLPCDEIGRILGIHRDTVWRKARKLGFKRPNRNNYRHHIKWPADFNEMWLSGVRMDHILAAAKGNLTCKSIVRREAQKRGLPPRVRGSQPGSITIDTYREIRLGKLMASAARAEQAAFIAADMADKCRNNRIVGADRARAAA